MLSIISERTQHTDVSNINETQHWAPILQDMADARTYADSYGVPVEDILMIALNIMGVWSDLPYPRMRFKNSFAHIPEDYFYTIVSLGRKTSPFFLTEDSITFAGEMLFNVSGLENDDVVSYYYRNACQELTLNSNARSKCSGCVFCPNTLELPNDPRIKELDSLVDFARNIAKENNQPDLSFLQKVTVCTGCFNSEERAIAHLTLVRTALRRVGYHGPLHYLGSVIRSEEGLRHIAQKLGPFHYTITVECLTRRAELLRRSKSSLDYSGMLRLCDLSRENNIEVDFSYVLGLDPLEITISGLSELCRRITTFPRINVFQPHNNEMQQYLAHGAERMDYYLGVRKALEDVFANTKMRPRSYQCYRPLWYFKFAQEDLPKVRI